MTTHDAIAAIRAAQEKADPIDLGLNCVVKLLKEREKSCVDCVWEDSMTYEYPCHHCTRNPNYYDHRAEAVAALKGEAHERD